MNTNWYVLVDRDIIQATTAVASVNTTVSYKQLHDITAEQYQDLEPNQTPNSFKAW